MKINELRDFENYYRRIEVSKENSYYSIKRHREKRSTIVSKKIKRKIPDPSNVKEYYQSYLKRKNIKSVKRSKTITHQLKTFENPNIVNIKSVIIEHLKTSHKLFKTIRQAVKISQVGSGSSSKKTFKKC